MGRPVQPSTPFPIQLLRQECLLYTLDGTPHSIDELREYHLSGDPGDLPDHFDLGDPDFLDINAPDKSDNVTPWLRTGQIAVAVEANMDTSHTAAMLDQAKSFSRKFFIDPFFKEVDMLFIMNTEPDEMLEMLDLPRSFLACMGQMRAHYRANEGRNPQERKEMLAAEVERSMAGITPAKVIEDYKKLHVSRPARLPPTIAMKQELRSGQLENALVASFQRQPEWLQVMVHEKGCRFITTPQDTEWLGITHRNQGIAHVSYATRLLDRPALLHLGVREELVHYFHESLRKEWMHDARSSALESRWEKLAKDLVADMQQDPRHPALELINKTEVGGGSLVDSSNLASAELLTDVFDAEIYLRTKDKAVIESADPKAATEKELRRVFGDEIYDISRTMLHSMLDHAVDMLEEKVGREEAGRYRDKWRDDPFLHDITLTRLPEYNLLGRQAQRGTWP